MKAVPFIPSRSRNSSLNPLWLAVSVTLLCIASIAQADVPNAIAHQGRIAVTGVNFEGNGQFKFLLFADADTDHASGNETPVWSNASTTPAAMTEPASAVTVPVTKGLYGTWLGDTSIANMAALPASVEPPAGTRLYLRAWFGDGVAPFVALAPDQAIAAVPFALSAASVTQGGVTADALAVGAVTAVKIAPGAVTGTVLGAGSVTADKIAPGAVTQLGTPGEAGSIVTSALLQARGFDQTGLASPRSVAVSGNFAYVIDLSSRLQIFDVSDPDNIVAKDFDQTGLGFPTSIAVSGNFAYVVDNSTDRLQIFDVTNANSIVAKDFDQTGLSDPTSIAVSGNFAYVVDNSTDRLQIFDVSNPDKIVAKDFDQTGLSAPKSVAVSGNFAYVVDSATSRLQIFDVSNPDNIVAKDFDQTGLSSPTSIAVSGDFAYVVDSTTDRLQIFDVSKPDSIVAMDFDQTGLSLPLSIAVSGNFAYVVDSTTDRLQIFDISNPDSIVATDFNQTGLFNPSSVAVSGDFVYIVDSATGSLHIFSTGTGLYSPGGLGLSGDLRVAGTANVEELQVLGNLNSSSANITGTVSANSFSFPAPKTFSLSIPGNAMLAQSAPDTYFRSTIGFIRPSGVTTSFTGVAPVQLPEGATITGMDIFYYDDSVGNSFTNLTTRLRRLDMFSTSGNPEQNIIALDVPSPTSPNSTTLVRSNNNSPDATRNVVDNTNFQYFVTVGTTVTAPDADLRFYGFRIRYTLTTLSP